VPTPEALWVLFKTHFNKAERDRHRQLTASGAGYNGANVAVVTPSTETAAAAQSSTSATTGTPPKAQKTLFADGMGGYCWTHGVTKNPTHTSATCENKATGHKVKATAFNRMGGSTKFPGMHKKKEDDAQE
jgi:hypothetical protein